MMTIITPVYKNIGIILRGTKFELDLNQKFYPQVLWLIEPPEDIDIYNNETIENRYKGTQIAI